MDKKKKAKEYTGTEVEKKITERSKLIKDLVPKEIVNTDKPNIYEYNGIESFEENPRFIKYKSPKKRMKEKIKKLKKKNAKLKESIETLQKHINDMNQKQKVEHVSKEAEDLYPVFIVMDRYGGTYSGGAYTAWNMCIDDIPSQIFGDDVTCGCWWDKYKDILEDNPNNIYKVGFGYTPAEALNDLAVRIHFEYNNSPEYDPDTMYANCDLISKYMLYDEEKEESEVTKNDLRTIPCEQFMYSTKHLLNDNDTKENDESSSEKYYYTLFNKMEALYKNNERFIQSALANKNNLAIGIDKLTDDEINAFTHVTATIFNENDFTKIFSNSNEEPKKEEAIPDSFNKYLYTFANILCDALCIEGPNLDDEFFSNNIYDMILSYVKHPDVVITDNPIWAYTLKKINSSGFRFNEALNRSLDKEYENHIKEYQTKNDSSSVNHKTKYVGKMIKKLDEMTENKTEEHQCHCGHCNVRSTMNSRHRETDECDNGDSSPRNNQQ